MQDIDESRISLRWVGGGGGWLIKDSHIKALEGNSRTLIVSTLMTDITGRS